MKKIRTPTYIALFLIGATSLWYFGHHRPTQKILTETPIKVYSGLPETVDATQVETHSSVTPAQMLRGKETKMEVQRTKVKADLDNAAILRKNGEVDNHINNTLSEESVQQNFHSDEEVAAFEDFFAAHSEWKEAQEQVIVALDSENPVQIKLATETLRNTRLKRKDVLEKLAVYSEEAAKLFIKAEADAQAIDERNAAIKAEITTEIVELMEKDPFLREFYEDLLPE